jgi:hypothetical protein
MDQNGLIGHNSFSMGLCMHRFSLNLPIVWMHVNMYSPIQISDSQRPRIRADNESSNLG